MQPIKRTRNTLGISDDETYSLYNNFHDHFLIDFTIYLLYNSKPLNFDNLSLMNKIHCNFMNSDYFTEVLGDNRFKLVNFHDHFLVLRDVVEDANFHFGFNQSQFLNIPRSIVEATQKLESEIEDILDNPDFESFREKYDYKNNFKEIVSHELTPAEKKIMMDFLKEFKEYQLFFKSNTVSNILNKKIENFEPNISVKKNLDFFEHYSNIKTIFPKEFYGEFDSKNDEFLKIKLFLENDLKLNYFYDTEQLVDNEIWLSIEKNNKYIGGSLVHSNEHLTTIQSTAIFESLINNVNIKYILKEIMKLPEVKKDVSFFGKYLFKDLTDKEIRKFYKDKRLYLTGAEEELFLDISYFIDVNKLDNREEILDMFYNTVLLPNQSLINSGKISNTLFNLNDNLKSKYVSNLLIKDNDISRNDFIDICVFLNHNEDISRRINRHIDFYFTVEVNKLNDKLVPLNAIRNLLDSMGVIMNELNYITLKDNLSNLGSYIDYHKENGDAQIFELNYNKLYDFLLDQKIINQGNFIKIYRIEDEDSIGIYRSSKISLLNSDTDKIYNYSNRKTPNRERDLAKIFDTNINENKYHLNYYFGFYSKKQITNWFKDDIQVLNNKDFKIVEYEVPSNYAIITNLQVAFHKDKVINKRSLLFEDLLTTESNEIKKKIKPL